MALEIALINGHPVVVDTSNTGVPYYTNDNITFANADKISRMNFAGSSKSTNPGASDWNYLPGAVWANTGTDQLYICVDNTSGAAQWKALGTISSVGSGLTGDGNTTPLRVAISPNANNSLSLLANGLYGQASSGTSSNAVEFYPEDYGAIASTTTLLPIDAPSLAIAQSNADAISDCIRAAHAASIFLNLSPGGNYSRVGGTINRKIAPKVVIDKHFEIAKPIKIPQQGYSLILDCPGGVISRWGEETGIYSWDYLNSGLFGIEIGEPYHEVSTIGFLQVNGLHLLGFNRGLRLGIAPNNYNQSQMEFNYCQFTGPRLSPNLYKTIGVRVFERSSQIAFNECQWNSFANAIDAQSVDRLFLTDCRIQVGGDLFNITHIPRRPNQAGIIGQHVRMKIEGLVANPPQPDAPLAAHYWAPNSGIAKNQYVAFTGVSKLYGSGTSLTSPTRTVWRSKIELTTSGTLAAETGNQAVFTSKWEPIPDEANKLGNIDTQRYFWLWMKEFDPWKPNTEYIPGDCILQPYPSGMGSPVYWTRLNYTTGSPATFAQDTGNWQIIDCMNDFSSTDTLRPGDIRRRAISQTDQRFYVNKSLSGTLSSMTVPESDSVNWQLIPFAAVTNTTDYPGITRRAGEPISAWTDLLIEGQCLFGAEAGGLTPIFWSAYPKEYNYSSPSIMPIGLEQNNDMTYRWSETRIMPKTLSIKDSTLQTDRRFENIEVTGVDNSDWFRPIIILSGMPNYLHVVNNKINDVLHSCVALYDPWAQKLPKFRMRNNGNYKSQLSFIVEGNAGGAAGTDLMTFPASGPSSFSYYHYSANYIPRDLSVPLLTQGISGLSQLGSFVPNKTVYIGDLITGIDPIDNKTQIFRSKMNRRTLGSFNSLEVKYWEICETGTKNTGKAVDIDIDTVAGGPFLSPSLLPGHYSYRSNNPVACKIANFRVVEEGKPFTIYHENGNVTYNNGSNAGILLATGTTVTVPSGGIMSFMPINFRVCEIYRSF